MAEMEWKDTELQQPPAGVPLIVTVRANWKAFPEVLGPVYRLQNAVNGGTEYFNFGTGSELGSITNSVIGPNGVRIVAWDFWPKPYEWDRWEKYEDDSAGSAGGA